jgi:hypothetical protein
VNEINKALTYFCAIQSFIKNNIAMSIKKHLLAAASVLVTITSTFAQNETKTAEPKFSVVFGLNQPILLKGFNFEGNYYTKKWVFDYSHGLGLNVEGKTLGNEFEKQNIDFRISHSWGIGVGYRINNGLNIRLEPKIHIYETYYSDTPQNKSSSIANFSTFTLGIGAYYRWLPFRNNKSALKGITIVPSVRYWPKVASTVSDGKVNYFNERTGNNETFTVPNIGVANTPWIVNISVGYSF